MEPFEKIQEYSKSVCDQIRWKKAHLVITEEIENHLADQRDAYIAEGENEITATDHAIIQMGDPVDIGTQLDRTHRPKPQWGMIFLVAIMLFGGIIIRSYINSGLKPEELISAFIGLGFLTAAYFSDFTLIGRFPIIVYFSILALSIAALILSPKVNGRAYYAGFMPLLFPLGFSAVLYATRRRGYLGIILCGISFMVPAFLSLLVPRMSGFLLFTITGLILFGIAIMKRWFNINRLFGNLLVYLPVAAAFLFVLPHSMRRLQIALNPSIDAAGSGWLGTVVRSLLDSSKLIGPEAIPAAYTTLPLSLDSINTDFLLTYLIFKFGWITFIVIMSVLLFFIIKGFMLSFRQSSCLGMAVSISIMLTFTMQVVGYVITNLGFFFSSPISFPLISYGKLATIINLTLIGIMLSVVRTGDIVRDKGFSKLNQNRFIEWSEGKLTISFSRK